METCKSPRTVLLVAHCFGQQALPQYASRFSRRDFTLPQLFACLALRTHQAQSFRDTEALLADRPEWCAALGMAKAPDHATLHRAFDRLTRKHRLDTLLDALARWARKARLLGDTLAVDSTQLDVRHRSRHYEQRCRHHARQGDKRSANARRSRSAKRAPKLASGVDTRSHLVLASRPRTGQGSDAPDFAPILRAARARHRRLRRVLADAGYDSHPNHRVAREELKIRSLIKTGAGRPTSKPPTSRYRRVA